MNECKYCGSLSDYLLAMETGENDYGDIFKVFVDISGDTIRCFDDNFENPSIESIKINFCPMCGKEL